MSERATTVVITRHRPRRRLELGRHRDQRGGAGLFGTLAA